MRSGTWVSIGIALLWSATEVAKAEDTRPVSEVAAGVHLIEHRSAPFEGGNTIVIIGSESVLVVDSGFIPYVAREDIATIATLTDKPVRYLLNTHWHNDHVMGIHAYAEAFPGLIILAQEQTARDMDLNIAQAARRTLPSWRAQIEQVDQQVSSLPQFEQPQRDTLMALRNRLVTAEADYRELTYRAPTLRFERGLTLDLGERQVRIEHLGRGNTNGDSVLYIGDAKVLISGDLLVYPLPYVHDGYASEWIDTLQRLRDFDAQIIIPGHGPALSDWHYLDQVRALFSAAIEQVNTRISEIGPAEFRTLAEIEGHVDLSSFKAAFASGDPEIAAEFDRMAGRLVRLVFKEASLR